MDRSGPASSSLRLAGDTFDDAIEQISGVFGAFGGRVTGRHCGFRWSSDFSSIGGLTLVSGHYEGAWEMWPVKETPEMLAIVRTRQGALDACLGSRVAAGSAGSLLVASNTETTRFCLRGDVNASDVLFIDWPIIARTVAGTFDRPLHGALDLAPEIDLTTSGGKTIMHLVDTMCAGMRPDGPLLHSPLAALQLTEALAGLVLLHVPNRFSRTLNDNPASLAPRHVKQAIDFMHENIGRPITIQAVAAAVGPSSRSLEVGFRAFKGTTPAAYLRTIRLEAARMELRDPATAFAISETAHRWGFFHLGRFAEIYRKAYGETPSETRSRRPEPR